MKKILIILFTMTLFLSGMLASALQISYVEDKIENKTLSMEDYDPLVDINITVDILAIRALDEIECSTLPNFYLKIFIEEEEFISPVWVNKSYLYDCIKISKYL